MTGLKCVISSSIGEVLCSGLGQWNRNTLFLLEKNQNILVNNSKNCTFTKFIAYLMQSCISGIKSIMPWPSKSSMNEWARGTHFSVLLQIKISLLKGKTILNIWDTDAIHYVHVFANKYMCNSRKKTNQDLYFLVIFYSAPS